MPGVIDAAFEWLAGATPTQLHGKYDFVDGQRRALESVEANLLRFAPELAQTARTMKPFGCDIFELWLANGDRDVCIKFWGKNRVPDFLFRWDRCDLIKEQTDNWADVAAAVSAWLCAHAAPSAMRHRFPSITISRVADYYEAGNPVEGEFVESWTRMERFYREGNTPETANALRIIQEIRNAGFDRSLRAGQSLMTLIVSRSRRHGLRAGQPTISFNFSKFAIDVWARLSSSGSGEHRVAFCLDPEIISLLQSLARQPID
jgi:hypothetical protein